MGKFNSYIRLSTGEKLLFAESLLLHLVTGLTLKIVPFRKIPSMFGNKVSDSNNIMTPLSDNSLVLLELIKSATQRASKISPWRNRCLVSSLAAKCMLRRRKIDSQLSLGLSKDQDGRVIAHAWLKAGDVELVPQSGDFITMFSF